MKKFFIVILTENHLHFVSKTTKFLRSNEFTLLSPLGKCQQEVLSEIVETNPVIPEAQRKKILNNNFFAFHVSGEFEKTLRFAQEKNEEAQKEVIFVIDIKE
jgi:hypothetical protein